MLVEVADGCCYIQCEDGRHCWD